MSDGDVLFGRLDFQATPQHRFMLRTNFTDYTGENGTSTATNRTATPIASSSSPRSWCRRGWCAT